MTPRSVLAVCASATALLTLATISAPVTAAESTATVLSPAADATVSGTIDVQVAVAGAPYVRLGVYTGAAKQDWRYLAPVVVPETGVVTFELPTWGYGHFSLRPQPCGSADPASCTPGGSRFVSVDNPPPVIEVPAAPGAVYTPLDGPLPVRASGPGPLIEFTLSNRHAVALPGEDALLDLAGAFEGAPTIHADWCNPLWPEECWGNWATGPTIVIRHALRADAPSSLAGVSPNGDGRSEEVGFGISLDEWRDGVAIDQTATWSLTSDGGEVIAPRPLWNGEARHGRQFVSADLFDVAGTTLPSGDYEFVLDLRGVIGSHVITNQVRIPLLIDITPTRIVRIRPSVRTFRPGSGESVRVTGDAVGGRARSIRACAVDRRHVAVRCWFDLRVRDGSVRFIWKGNDKDGRPARQGYYRFEFTTWDPYGNSATTSGGRVYLSRARG